MIDTSKVFRNAVINLYKDSVYTVDYAIMKASELSDKNKINAKDYEELITYLADEQNKKMQENEEEVVQAGEQDVEDTEMQENEQSTETEVG